MARPTWDELRQAEIAAREQAERQHETAVAPARGRRACCVEGCPLWASPGKPHCIEHKPPPRYCKGINTDGRRCKHPVAGDREYCPWHWDQCK